MQNRGIESKSLSSLCPTVSNPHGLQRNGSATQPSAVIFALLTWIHLNIGFQPSQGDSESANIF